VETHTPELRWRCRMIVAPRGHAQPRADAGDAAGERQPEQPRASKINSKCDFLRAMGRCNRAFRVSLRGRLLRNHWNGIAVLARQT